MPYRQVRRCDYCSSVQDRKLCAAYGRWYPLNSDAVGYVLKLCDGCVQEWLAPALNTSWELSHENESCPLCHDPVPEDLLFAWLTCFARGEPAAAFTVIGCEDCSTKFRARFIAKGRKLENRAREDQVPAEDYWLTMGIERSAVS